MILVVFGTTGELIKLAPVLLRLDERGHPYVLATTGQQVLGINVISIGGFALSAVLGVWLLWGVVRSGRL